MVKQIALLRFEHRKIFTAKVIPACLRSQEVSGDGMAWSLRIAGFVTTCATSMR